MVGVATALCFGVRVALFSSSISLVLFKYFSTTIDGSPCFPVLCLFLPIIGFDKAQFKILVQRVYSISSDLPGCFYQCQLCGIYGPTIVAGS